MEGKHVPAPTQSDGNASLKNDERECSEASVFFFAHARTNPPHPSSRTDTMKRALSFSSSEGELQTLAFGGGGRAPGLSLPRPTHPSLFRHSDDDTSRPTPRHVPGARPPSQALEALATTALVSSGDPETLTRGAGGSQRRRTPSPPPRHPTPPPACPVLAAEKSLAETPGALSRSWLASVRDAWHARAAAAATPAALAASLAALRSATSDDAVDAAWSARVAAMATSRVATLADVAAAAEQLVEGGTARAATRSRAPSPEAAPHAQPPPPDATVADTDARVAALESRVAWLERGLAAVAEAARGQFEALADGVAWAKGHGGAEE